MGLVSTLDGSVVRFYFNWVRLGFVPRFGEKASHIRAWRKRMLDTTSCLVVRR